MKLSTNLKFASVKKTNNYRKITVASLIKLNLIAGFLHLAQGVVMLIIAKQYLLPITTSYLVFDEATQSLVSATKQLFNFNYVYIPVSFVFLSAAAHFIVATVYKKRYADDLNKGINIARWVEYSVSASVMMVGIAMLVGVYDISTILLLFGLTSAMNLMGLVMELWNQKSSTVNWLAYWLGCLFGIVPWVVVVWVLVAGAAYGSVAPTFVYFIYVSMFVMFTSFAVNMWLQYKKIGKWSDYFYGERVYIVLSLVAKALLAWQIFAGTLRP